MTPPHETLSVLIEAVARREWADKHSVTFKNRASLPFDNGGFVINADMGGVAALDAAGVIRVFLHGSGREIEPALWDLRSSLRRLSKTHPDIARLVKYHMDWYGQRAERPLSLERLIEVTAHRQWEDKNSLTAMTGTHMPMETRRGFVIYADLGGVVVLDPSGDLRCFGYCGVGEREPSPVARQASMEALTDHYPELAHRLKQLTLT